MSDALKDKLREPLRRAFEAGRAFERTLVAAPQMFSADVGDGPAVTAAYGPDDIERWHEYFEPDERGYFPGHFHRLFACGHKEFGQRAKMVRVFAASEGKAGWVWKRRTFAAPGPPPRPGWQWKEETHRWINPENGEAHEHETASRLPTQHYDAARAVGASVSAEVLSGSPEVAADPAVRQKVADLALTAAARAYKVALDITTSRWTQRLAGILEGVFDTPNDLKKFGYNPGMAGGQDNASLGHNDFLKKNLQDTLGVGISGHLAASIASKVAVKALFWLKAKLNSKPAEMAGEGDWVAGVAEPLADLFDAANESVGLPKVDRAAVLAAVRALAGAPQTAEPRTFSAPTLGPVERRKPSDLLVDPDRLQYRAGADEDDGTVRELPDEEFDPARCKPLVGWKDPDDGSEYVVDGHHRLAWADRDDAEEVPVRFVDAPTAEAAREYGKRLNEAMQMAAAFSVGVGPTSVVVATFATQHKVGDTWQSGNRIYTKTSTGITWKLASGGGKGGTKATKDALKPVAAPAKEVEAKGEPQPKSIPPKEYIDAAKQNAKPGDKRDLATQLASAWARANDAGHSDAVAALGKELKKLGAAPHGPEAGETVAHNGKYYDAPTGVGPGDKVFVLRQPVVHEGTVVSKGEVATTAPKVAPKAEPKVEPAAKEKPAPATKPDKATVKADSLKAAREALANPKTVDPMKLAEHLSNLTKADLVALKSEAGFKGGTTKTELLAKFIVAVKEKAKASKSEPKKPDAAPKPAGKPADESAAGGKDAAAPPEPGFTGTDALGREWVNGKLVAKTDESKPADKPTPKAEKEQPPKATTPPAAAAKKEAAKKAVADAIAKPAESDPIAVAEQLKSLTIPELKSLMSAHGGLWAPAGSPKQKLIDKFKGYLKTKQWAAQQVAQKKVANKTAGGQPSEHFDHVSQDKFFDKSKPSEKFKADNPYANSAALGDEDVEGIPNHDLPDATRPAVKDKKVAQAINNYSWGYDGPMNAALRDTGEPPPGPFGGYAGVDPLGGLSADAKAFVQGSGGKLTADIVSELGSKDAATISALGKVLGVPVNDPPTAYQKTVLASEIKKASSDKATPGKPNKDGPEMFAGLQKAFAGTKPFGPPPITVYRGIQSLPADLVNNMEAAANKAKASGGTVTMPGFVSTSTDRTVASGFTGPVSFTIHAIHGLDAKPYSHFPTESELLLNHNCQYRVKNVTRNGSKIHIEMEQVSGGLSPKGISLDGTPQ